MARIPTSVLAALATSLLGACGGAAEGRPNVLLVAVDTLGAAQLGCYGLEPSPTPHVDRLAAEGTLFERAYATAPWTQPSFASLFTGRMPARHGVRNLADRLGADEETLAERFSRGGWQTHGVVSHFLLEARFGFDQGFAGYDAGPVGGHDGISSAEVTERALRWLEEGRDERPFFLFVHFFDPHFLYHHHAEHDRTAGYDGPLSPAMPIWSLRDARGSLKDADVAYLVGLHREEIAHTDAHVGRLLARIDELGLADDTLVVFTADHGEEFLEHGWIGHTRSLYDELIRVPLVLRLPGRIPIGRQAEPVSLIDVAPTLLELAGLEPLADTEGRSLAPLLSGAAPESRPLFAEVSFDPPSANPERRREKTAFLTAVVLDGWKLVHDELGERYELYDLARDPSERTNLFGRDPERDARLVGILAAWEAERPGADGSGDGGTDTEELEELRRLGYVR